MAKQKKPNYEYVEALNLYRKRVRDAGGKRIALYGRTVAELENRIAEYNRANLEPEEDGKDPFVNNYIDAWFDLSCGHLSDGTKRDYGSVIAHHIKPYFEGVRMSEVYPRDIAAAVSHTISMSESIHNKTYMILKRVFTFAYDNGDISMNPCPVMHNGGKAPVQKTALTAKQKKILLDAVKGTRAYLFCMIGLYAGLRTEEILGLKWDCVHLADVPYIEVKRALRFKGNKSTLSDTLKTTASQRNVPIPAPLLQVLTEAKAASQHEFLFSSKSGGPYSKIQFRELWQIVNRRQVGKHSYLRPVDGKLVRFEYMGEMGEKSTHGRNVYCIYFKVTPHILRHTYISDLIAGGVDIKTVQYLAGHETSKTTLDIYTHLTYHNADKILAKVNRAFSEAAKRE